MRRVRVHLGAIFWQAALAAFFAVFLIYPISFTLRRAFLDERGGWTLGPLASLFENPLIRQSLLNSAAIATLTTLGACLLALPLAHVMTRRSFPGKGWISGLLLAPMMMPPFVGAIGLQQILGRYGTLNLLLMKLGLVSPASPIQWLGEGGFWGIVALQILALFPIPYLNISAAMANVDPALWEAAQNLGASGRRMFRTVTLPLIAPGVFAGASIVFIWSFTDLGTPLVFGYSRVVSVQIFDAIHELNTNPQGYALATAVLGLTLALFLTTRRWFARSRWDAAPRGAHAESERPLGRWHGRLVLAATLCLLAAALLPHLAVLTESFSDRWLFSAFPQKWTLDHYREALAGGQAAISLRNSLFYSSLSAGLDLVLGVAIAWLATRKRAILAPALDALAMAPLAIPGLVLAFGFVAAFDVDAPWLNPRQNPTLLLVIAYSVRRLPYMVRAAVAGFQQSPVELEEASANLGASPFRTLRRVTLPLVSANLIAGCILAFAFAMIEVSDSLILAMREPYFPLTKAVYELLGRIEPDAPSVACALSALGMAVLAAALLTSARLLGRRMGRLFRF